MLELLNEFFSPKLGQYENFTFNEGSFVSFKVVIAGIFFGVILASLCAIYNRRILGDFIRRVIEKGALSRESALTLEELGYSKKFFIKYSLTRGNTLRRAVSCVEEDEFSETLKKEDPEGDKKKIGADFKRDAKTAHFYIPEEKRYKMEYKFDKKGTNWLTFVITLVVLIAATVLIVRYLPNILKFIDGMLG